MPETDRYNDINLEVVTSINHRDFSVVEVMLHVKGSDCLPANLGDEGLVGLGFSKRDPIDKANPSLGFDLALGRALSDLGRRVMRRANGRVKQLDDLALDKERQWLRNLATNNPELLEILNSYDIPVAPVVVEKKTKPKKAVSTRKVMASAKKS